MNHADALKTWLLALSLGLCPHSSFASPTGAPQTPVAAGADLPRDVSGDDLAEDELLDGEIDDSEFLPDDAEVRALRQSLLAVSLGESFPWQSWSLEVGSLMGLRQISIFAGGGHFAESSLRRSSGSWSIDADTRSVGLAMRAWLPRVPMMSGAVSLSWGSWEGSVSPIGVESEGTITSESLLPGSFRLTGLTLGLAPSLSRSWTNGVWIEWVPVGIRRTWVLSRRWSRPSTKDSSVTDWVQRFEVWGFVNFKIGWRF